MRDLKLYLYIGMIILFCSGELVLASEMSESSNQTVNQAQMIKSQEKSENQSGEISPSKEKSGQKSFQGPQGQQYGMPHSGYELKRWW